MVTHSQEFASRLCRFGTLLAIGVLITGCFLVGGVVQGDEKTITLVIEFGDRAKTKQFDDIKWKDKMTVLDAMNVVKDKSPGIEFVYGGKGRTALLTRIDDVKNEGASGLNWIFDVNGKLADRGFGVFSLQANDVVTWKFGKYP